MKFPPILYVLISLVFFIFLYALGAMYPEIVKSTKITDWASAVFNGVVAIMAVAAYFVAKNWKRQKMDEDAYQLSKEIVLNNYRDIANVHSSICGICDYYGVMIAALPQRGKEYMPTFENIREYNEKLYSIYELRRALMTISFL